MGLMFDTLCEELRFVVIRCGVVVLLKAEGPGEVKSRKRRGRRPKQALPSKTA